MRGWIALALSLAPALAAIWGVPWFVTQDGPAHLYNAQILAWSFDPNSPFRDVYRVQWQPIPNWGGHLFLAGLVTLVPAWVADRVVTSVTLVGFAASLLWLRWRVAGQRGLVVAAFLAALLSMNLAWIMGFASFMLGASLVPLALGFWWTNRDQFDVRRAAVLAALLILGYFCHVLSVALIALSLVVLSLWVPSSQGSESPWHQRFWRLARTSLCFIPCAMLGLFYVRLARQRAPLHPTWENLSDPLSPAAWVNRLGWVDPLTLAVKDGLPLTDQAGKAYVFFAPAVWLAIALTLWWFGRITPSARAGAHDLAKDPIDAARLTGSVVAVDADSRAGWLMLGALLLFLGVAGPDSFGPAHGEFLPQRLALLGLAALVPVFDLDASRWVGRGAIAAVILALGLQALIVWDYALYSDKTAGQIIRAGPAVGRLKRIVTLLVTTRSRFRTNPLLHAENWLGVDTGNIVWNNYETVHYYFPVHFRAGIDRPGPAELERISIREGPEEATSRASAWEQVLARHANSMDVLLVWKRELGLDAVTARYFDQVDCRGELRIFQRGQRALADQGAWPGLFAATRSSAAPRKPAPDPESRVAATIQ
jgi:hypothetical protein